MRVLRLLLIGATVPALGGCLERTIRVTTDPPGAMVWLNDVEIGRSPAEARFKFHGVYDVRIEMPGHEPIHEGREAVAPWYEYPGPDLIAAALPMRFHNLIEWHFILKPMPPIGTDEGRDQLVERALGVRDRLGPAPEPKPAPAASASEEAERPAAPPTFEPVRPGA